MRVKRYVVDSMPEAIAKNSQRFGKDAVILSTKEIKVGGVMGMFRKKRIEVVAAVDKEENKQTTKPVQNQFTPVPRAFVPEAYRQTARSFVAASDESVQRIQLIKVYRTNLRLLRLCLNRVISVQT